jgi:hypothetical protein
MLCANFVESWAEIGIFQLGRSLTEGVGNAVAIITIASRAPLPPRS